MLINYILDAERAYIYTVLLSDVLGVTAGLHDGGHRTPTDLSTDSETTSHGITSNGTVESSGAMSSGTTNKEAPDSGALGSGNPNRGTS